MCGAADDPTQHDGPFTAHAREDDRLDALERDRDRPGDPADEPERPLTWLDKIAAEQRPLMARWGYTPEMVAEAADEDPGEAGEIEQGWPR